MFENFKKEMKKRNEQTAITKAEYAETLYIRYSQRSAGGKTYLELTNNGKLVEKVEFEDTGSENKDWKLKKVKLKIYPGANAIKLTSLSTEAPSIDSFELH